MPSRVSYPVLLALSLGACAGETPPASAPLEAHAGEPADRDPRDEAGSTRASREARLEHETTGTLAPETTVTPTADRPLLTLSRSDAERAEDGRGNVVPATLAVAFDLDARRFPPRALDPVLIVGELRFVHYVHPRPGVLRFVAADASALEGVEVAVQYGGDASSRVVVAPALSPAGVAP